MEGEKIKGKRSQKAKARRENSINMAGHLAIGIPQKFFILFK